MSWEIIHRRLIHPSDSVIKSMFHHQTLTYIPKHFPKKLNQSQCTICYTAKMTAIPKRTKVYKTNLQPVEIIHMYFVFYNVTSIRGFTSLLTVLCENTRILWLFPNTSKRYLVCIIRVILRTLNN